MQRRLLLLAVVAGLAGLFSNIGPTFADPTPDIVVDTFCAACEEGSTSWPGRLLVVKPSQFRYGVYPKELLVSDPRTRLQ
jgi:hypothetical protein